MSASFQDDARYFLSTEASARYLGQDLVGGLERMNNVPDSLRLRQHGADFVEKFLWIGPQGRQDGTHDNLHLRCRECLEHSVAGMPCLRPSGDEEYFHRTALRRATGFKV